MSDPLPPIVFEALHPDVRMPERQTTEAAGYDLRAYLRGRRVTVRRADRAEPGEVDTDDSLELQPGDVALVPTGFRARLPSGYEAQIRLRSSLACLASPTSTSLDLRITLNATIRPDSFSLPRYTVPHKPRPSSRRSV